jgi:hypothetical protein
MLQRFEILCQDRCLSVMDRDQDRVSSPSIEPTQSGEVEPIPFECPPYEDTSSMIWRDFKPF